MTTPAVNEMHYLGDGVYVSYDGYQMCLKANSHIRPTDEVFIDRQVWSSLVAFSERCFGLVVPSASEIAEMQTRGEESDYSHSDEAHGDGE